MKLLAFVDLHGDTNLFKRLLNRAKEKDIDLVVVAGDLTQFEGGLTYFIKKLNSLRKKILIIPGNHEGEKLLKRIVEKYENLVYLHKKAVKISDYVFLGYGEGGFSLEDPEFRQFARNWYSAYQKENIIFVTHGPPFGTKLDKLGQHHVGNKDFRGFIERIKPKLVLCGHLHELAGKIDALGETKVVNPGWEGLVIELS